MIDLKNAEAVLEQLLELNRGVSARHKLLIGSEREAPEKIQRVVERQQPISRWAASMLTIEVGK